MYSNRVSEALRQQVDLVLYDYITSQLEGGVENCIHKNIPSECYGFEPDTEGTNCSTLIGLAGIFCTSFKEFVDYNS